MPPKRKKKFVAKKRPKAPQPDLVRRQIIVGTSIALTLTLIITAIYFFSRVESKQITSVEVVGGQTISHAEIRRLVETELTGSYYRLVPKRFTWTYPKDTIREKLQSLDRVKQVDISRDDQAVYVVFDEHIPAALWCAAEETSCLFIDRTGYAFAPAPELTGGAFVRFTQAGEVPQLATNGFDREFMSATNDFIERLQAELGLFVTEVTLIGDQDIEFTVSGGGVIKVSQRLALEQSFRNLRTVLQLEEFIHLEPGTFQYIDLRFGDKVFVNEEMPDITLSTSSATSS